MTKNKLIKIAINQMEKSGVENLNISTLSQYTRISVERLNQIFIHKDDELLMDTVETAGRFWIGKIKEQIDNRENIKDKLETLIISYVLGTEKHPQSLSVYIDLWKTIKDSQDTYLRERLKQIYLFYINSFNEIVKEIVSVYSISEGELKAFSLMATILSDVIHIQSVTLQNEVDFDEIRIVLSKILKCFLNIKEPEKNIF